MEISGGDVSFTIMLTTPACPVKEEMESDATAIVSNLEGVTSVKVRMDAEVPQGRGIANTVAIPGVNNIIAVSSGMGGVGTSTVAVNLATTNLLDLELVGTIERLLRIHGVPADQHEILLTGTWHEGSTLPPRH